MQLVETYTAKHVKTYIVKLVHTYMLFSSTTIEPSFHPSAAKFRHEKTTTTTNKQTNKQTSKKTAE